MRRLWWVVLLLILPACGSAAPGPEVAPTLLKPSARTGSPRSGPAERGFPQPVPSSTELPGFISGTVVDLDRAPQRSVCVEAWGREPDEGDEPAGAMRTKADGGFRLGPFEPGTYSLRFFGCESDRPEFLHDWYPMADGWDEARRLTFRPGEGIDGLSLVVVRSAVIEGTVVGPDDEGVPNLCVEAFATGSGRYSVAVTDAGGSYRLARRLVVGSYELRARYVAGVCNPDGDRHLWSPEIRTVRLEPEEVRHGIDFRMRELGGVRVRVTDPLGVPLPRVCVDAYAEPPPGDEASGGDEYCRDRLTDADGRLTLYMKPGEYRIHLTHQTEDGWGDEWFEDQDSYGAADPVTIRGSGFVDVAVMMG